MDPLLVFISFTHDGEAFAHDLNERLNQVPFVTSWIYTERNLGYPFYPELMKHLQPAELILFLVTRQSPHSDWCTSELQYAKDTGKRIIPLIVHPGVDFSLLLQGYQPLHCTTGVEEIWDELRREVDKLMSPQAKFEVLDEKLRLARRALERAPEQDRPRHETEVRAIEDRWREAERRARDPQGSLLRQEAEIKRGQERERAGVAEPDDSSGLRCVNHPPPMMRNRFRNRSPQIRFLQDRLRDPKVRLVAIAGRSGNGKTAMISQWRENLRGSELEPRIGAFVYLPAYGTRPITASVLLEELGRAVVDPAARARLESPETGLSNPSRTVYDKLEEVLAALAGLTVVVIDDAGALLDAAGRIRDPELAEIVDTLLRRSNHRVKLILVAQDLPELLLAANPTSAVGLQLDKGLPLEDSRSFLRALDEDGACGLSSAPEEHLTRVWRLTGGSPRALEAIATILREGRTPSLLKLLDDLTGAQDVLEVLIGLVFNGLEAADQRILQVLAAYEHPVLPSAVDFVLEDYLPGFVSEPALRRLAGRQLIRQYGERFYLPPSPDGEFILAGIPPGGPGEGEESGTPKVTRLALCRRAAQYFVGTRKRVVGSIDDLHAEFAEIRLLMRAGDLQAANKLIDAVDEERLSRWGYSSVLSNWRQELEGRLGAPRLEMNNYLGLADAHTQQGRARQALAALESAQELAAASPQPEARIIVGINLGTVRQELGLTEAAIGDYTRAQQEARERRLFPQEVMAALGHARCLSRKGLLDEAVKQYEELLARMPQEGPDRRLEAQLHLNLAVQLTALGRGVEALEHVARGLAVVPSDEYVLRGHLFGEQAEVHIAGDGWERALKPAGEAAELATQTRDVQLTCEANRTLALAHLCGAQLEKAWHAADTAVHYGLGLGSMTAFAVKGITAYRLGENRDAREAFLEAHLRARTLLERESEAFQVLETEGLVLYGLTRCGGPDQTDLAIAAYQAARRITRARGAVQRSLLLLDKLAIDARADGYAEIRRAAAGL